MTKKIHPFAWKGWSVTGGMAKGSVFNLKLKYWVSNNQRFASFSLSPYSTNEGVDAYLEGATWRLGPAAGPHFAAGDSYAPSRAPGPNSLQHTEKTTH